MAEVDYAAEADEARDRIASTIDELQERLSPRRVLAEAVEGVQAQGNALFDQARDILKAHPLAIGAVGAAVGLALFTGTKISHAKVDLGDDYRGYTDYDDDYVGEPAAAFEDHAELPATSPPPVRATRLATTSARVEQNPIVSIVVGLAAGAVLGAVFPASEREQRLFGETGERFTRAARAAARQAKDELDAHGLSMETAREKAANVAAQAKAAVQSVAAAARQEYKGGNS